MSQRPPEYRNSPQRRGIINQLQKKRQILFSVPGYLQELSRLRCPRELYSWIYFKCPYLFPLRNIPTYVTVEPTNSCNLSCKHCWHASMARPIGHMDVEVFEKIVREAGLFKPSLFKIGGAGEPAVHPRFRELMAVLAPHRLKVFVYTNGALLRRFTAEEVMSWGIDTIVVSVDGLDSATYEKIKIGSRYEDLKNLIVNFHEYRNGSNRRKPVLEVRHIIMPKEPAAQILKFRNQWLSLADTVRFNAFEPESGFFQFDDPFPPRCRQIRRELCIQWDGRVPVCGGYREYAGNVRDHCLIDLWRDPRVEFLRQCNLRRDFAQIPLCRRCCHCR
jgi:MoaA/NifB/PqqE/SkfB family radical SAM enzyme